MDSPIQHEPGGQEGGGLQREAVKLVEISAMIIEISITGNCSKSTSYATSGTESMCTWKTSMARNVRYFGDGRDMNSLPSGNIPAAPKTTQIVRSAVATRHLYFFSTASKTRTNCRTGFWRYRRVEAAFDQPACQVACLSVAEQLRQLVRRRRVGFQRGSRLSRQCLNKKSMKSKPRPTLSMPASRATYSM